MRCACARILTNFFYITTCKNRNRKAGTPVFGVPFFCLESKKEADFTAFFNSVNKL